MERSLDEISVGEVFKYYKDTYIKVTENHLYWFNSEDYYKVEAGYNINDYPSVGYVAEGLQ